MLLPKLERVQRRYLTSRRTRERENQETLVVKAQEKESRLKSWLPRLSSWLKPQRIESFDMSFIPCPKITFLVDKPRHLMCTICQITPLTFHSNDSDREHAHKSFPDAVPAIMPCGHLAGMACLSTWFEEHDTCPFCRLRLTYRKCGHQIPIRPVTDGTIFLIPATIPEGGAIPDLCLRCHEAALRRTAEVRLSACKRRFRTASVRFRASMGSDEAKVFLERKAELEKIMMEEFYVKVTNAWLGSW